MQGKQNPSTYWLLGKADFPYRVDLSAAVELENRTEYWKTAEFYNQGPAAEKSANVIVHSSFETEKSPQITESKSFEAEKSLPPIVDKGLKTEKNTESITLVDTA